MINFTTAGRLPAIAAACLMAAGMSAEAGAQVATTAANVLKVDYQLPATARPAMTQAVVKTSVPTVPATPAVVQTAPVQAVQPAPAMQQPNLSGWPLWALVEANKQGEALGPELNCVAVAVYFEARGEPLEGQLAVAEVVMNRASSGKYPSSWCAVVKQPWQFSFVRRGQFPRVNESSQQWAKAQAIARIAAKQLADELPDDVLWYHANYVSPSWGRRLSKVEQIGAHIFYRA